VKRPSEPRAISGTVASGVERQQRRAAFGAGVDAFRRSQLRGGGLDLRFIDGDGAAAESRSARSIRRSPIARGTRSPHAPVRGDSHSGALSSPSFEARGRSARSRSTAP
jgi:hypothetical protein